MSPRRRRRKKRSALDYIRLPGLPHLDLDPDTKKGIYIVLILAVGAIGLLGLFDMAGLMGEYLKAWLIIGFGWGKWLLPIILIFIGYALFDEERFELRGRNYLGFFIFILSSSGVIIQISLFRYAFTASKSTLSTSLGCTLIINSFARKSESK